MAAMKTKDLRETVIAPNVDRQKILEERFGDRLILRQHWGEKPKKVTERVVKNAKQNQLDPDSGDKWGHDLYNGPPKTKQHETKAQVVPVEEDEVEEKPKKKQSGLNKVLVRNLPNDITKQQVEAIFSRYGKVVKAQVEEGIAIVLFSDNEGALQAHYVTNHKKLLKINGNAVKVSMIEDEESKR